jgi:ABC-2 type transport system permease protein
VPSSVPSPARPSQVLRYVGILRAQATVSATTAMQYRFDFVLKGVLALFWVAVTLVPTFVVFGRRPSVAGWTFPEALVVLGWFTALKALLDGGISPSLVAVVEGIRSGSLDFVLLKPADAQFLVSTSRFDPWRLIDLLSASAILAYAFWRLGRMPAPAELGLGALLMVVALVLLYSIWIVIISASFWAVRVDNLSYLFGSLFDAGRWPVDVFRTALGGVLRIIFTFVFPLGLMTTVPARALLGRLDASAALGALLGGLIFAAGARLVWRRAIAAYTSASS